PRPLTLWYPLSSSLYLVITALVTSSQLFSFLMTRPPPISTLFPYTTLFRSGWLKVELRRAPRDIDYRDGTNGGVMAVRRGWRRSDRKSTRLNSSHVSISYAVFCLKKKKKLIHIVHKPNRHRLK